MRQPESSSYEDLLQAFKEAINRVLTGSGLPPAFARLDVPLTLALLDVAHAVRHKRPTHVAVANACNAFDAYTVQRGAKRPKGRARRIDVAR